MSDVRTFRADTMQDALELVRREMGSEAVILHTKQFTRRRLLPWRRPREQVEITAGLGVNIRPPRDPQPAESPGSSPQPRAGSPSREPTFGEFVRSGGLDSVSGGISLDGSGGDAPETGHAANAASEDGAANAPEAASPAETETGQAAAGPDPAALFADRLETIERMLADLGRPGPRAGEDIPRELFALYTELIDADVEDDLARELVSRLKENAAPEQLADVDAARAVLTGLVESEIRAAEPIAPTPGRRKVVALVGTTGVGKTTTIAKLAADFRLRDGVKMGLVTVDTYRIAAVEQLRTYAEIIDLPMKVVTSPPEMRRALDDLAGLDLVLIDTAGRSPRDDLQIQELKSLLAEADVDEVHLVLSLTASPRSLLATAERFGAANPTALVLTKLDEAAGLGSLLSLTRHVSLPISYLTTGQDVPDDIEPAQSSRIARLILGQDQLLD